MFPSSFDDAPAQEPPPRRRSNIALWLVVFGLGILLLTLFMISSAIQRENARTLSAVNTLQSGLTATAPINPTEDALQTEFLHLRQRVRELETLHPTLVQSHLNWPAILSSLGVYNPQQISLTSLTQFENRLNINGQSTEESIILAYAQTLQSSGLFTRVIIQSMRVVMPPTFTPTPTPTRSPDATNTIATPTLTSAEELSLQPSRYVEFILLVELKAQEP